MNLLSLSVFIVLFVAALAEIKVASQEFIDSINQKQSSWVAGRNFPENTSDEYLRKLSGFLGIHPDKNYKPKVKVYNVRANDIPPTYDARITWRYCPIGSIRNQGACGSCWAFAAVEIIRDRICSQSPYSSVGPISVEDVLSCCTSCGNCDGGYTKKAFDFYINEGIVSGGDYNSDWGCKPYTSDPYNDGRTPACTKSCSKNYSMSYNEDKFYGLEDYLVGNSEDQIQHELMTNGPLTLSFDVFQDFYNYRYGVYQHVSGNKTGSHAVKVIGWGVDTQSELPYWLIANSWGESWGENGFFRIVRGRNECGIETYPYAVLPIIPKT